MTVLVFKLNEYQARLTKSRERMSEQNIDVLVITEPANMYYLTGCDTWSFYVHQVVIVGLLGDDPYLIGRESDSNGALLTTYLSKNKQMPW